jgi:hypothetical protein
MATVTDYGAGRRTRTRHGEMIVANLMKNAEQRRRSSAGDPAFRQSRAGPATQRFARPS